MRVACEIVLTDNEQLALTSLVHSKLTSVRLAHHAAGRFRDAVSAASPPHRVAEVSQAKVIRANDRLSSKQTATLD